MGRMNAEGMAESGLPLELTLEWHLQSNHYPPVSLAFIPTCVKAIQCCKDGASDTDITMPNGLVHSAAEIVEGLHLEPFLYDYEEGYD